jgi:hypothetical protein
MATLTRIVGLGAFLAVFIYSNDALADSVKDVTCEQFLAMDDGARNNIVYWVHGVQVASTKKTAGAEEIDVAYDAFGRPVAEVVTACEEDKKASLWDKIKAHF